MNGGKLTSYAIQEGYEWHLVETGATFLLWKGTIRNGQFPLPDDPFVMAKGRTFPSVVYLQRRAVGRIESWRNALNSERDRLRGTPEGKLERLRARSERQIRRRGRQLEEPFQRVRRLLMVWQAEHDGDTREEIQATAARFVRLWNGFKKGVLPDVIEGWLPGLPSCRVSKVQSEGVRYYTTQRESVLEDLIPEYRTWWACEALLSVARRQGESGEALPLLPFNGCTRKQRQHVRRAAYVLEKRSGLERKEGENSFFDAAEELRRDIDNASGAAIWRGVRRCAKGSAGLESHESLPRHYHGMEGFRKLVNDLMSGNYPA